MISGQIPGRQRVVAADWVVVLHGRKTPVSVTLRDGGYDISLKSGTLAVQSAWKLGEPLFQGMLEGRRFCMQVERAGIAYRLTHAGTEADVLVLTPRTAELRALMPEKAAPDTSKSLLSPMPGLLVSLAVAPGQEVKEGEELAVVEAMKMENVLRAGQDGVVSAVRAEPGESLTVDQVILEFE